MNPPLSILLRALPLLATLLTWGCASYSDLPPGTVKAVTATPILEREPISVPAFFDEGPPPADYQVGPGDILYVNVFGQDELGSPNQRVTASGKVQGSRIDGAGNLHLPLVGTVPVAGRSVSEVGQELKKAFSGYLNDPWVVVEVADHRSQPLHLLGQFNLPGTRYMDRPLTLLEGLALGNGLTDMASLRSARLIRDQKTIPVDLQQLLQEGVSAQNVWLRPGDTIFVPDSRNQNVFVFGSVKKPGSVPMPNGQLTLAQALSSAGIEEARDNEKHIRIIRSLSATRGELLVVDLGRILRGEALPFPLMEGDIVYVPRGALGNWNQAISELLPTLQAVSAILQPFVQIKFLTDED